MSSKLFGLEVTKKEKQIALICGIFAAVFFVIYLILSLFEVEPEVEIIIPTGGLTESVFDSQNLVYQPEDAYTIKNSFKNVPYTIDTVEGQKASIGASNIYKYEPYYFYYSEIKAGSSLVESLRSELTSVISISADPADTQISVLTEKTGYVNGCAAKFYCLEIVAGGDKANPHYMCLYQLNFDDSVYVTDWDILVGCMSNTCSTDALAGLEGLAYASVFTLQYDRNLEKE